MRTDLNFRKKNSLLVKLPIILFLAARVIAKLNENVAGSECFRCNLHWVLILKMPNVKYNDYLMILVSFAVVMATVRFGMGNTILFSGTNPADKLSWISIGIIDSYALLPKKHS